MTAADRVKLRDDEILFTRREAAEVLRRKAKTLSEWARDGRGPRITRLNGRPFYRRADLFTYINGGAG